MSYRRAAVTDLPGANRELEQIERTINGPLNIITVHAAPLKPRDGITVLADGTDWNPGAGQGVYTYYNGAWHKLG